MPPQFSEGSPAHFIAAQALAGSSVAFVGSAWPQKQALAYSTPATLYPSAEHRPAHHSRLLSPSLTVTVCGSTRAGQVPPFGHWPSW